MAQDQMFDLTPEERLLKVRQTLVSELERHQKAIDSATAKYNKTAELLSTFDEGCRGLGMRAEAFALTDALESQFDTAPEDDDDEIPE